MPDAQPKTPVARNPVKCSICGCQSPLFTLFVLDKEGNWRCPRCQVRYAQAKQRQSYWALLLSYALALAFFAFLGLRGDAAAAYIGVNLLLYLLFLSMLVPLHELAHAAGAWAMAGVVFALYFGYGPGMRQRRFGSLVIGAQPLPLMGFCVAGFPVLRRIRGSAAVYVAAPLLMHTLFLLALLPGFQPIRLVTGPAWLEVFVIVNALALVLNLLPRQGAVGAAMIASDGLALRRLARRQTKAEDLHTSYFVTAMSYAYQAGDYQRAAQASRAGLAVYPDNPHLRSGLSASLLNLHDYDAARLVLEDLLAAGDALSPDVRALAWNNLAYLTVEQGATGPALNQALDDARQAWSLLPWMPEVQGTLGSVLTAQGRSEEGLSHLVAAYPDLSTDPHRASNLSYQALAHWQQGNVAAAQDLLRRAGQLDPDSATAQRITAQLVKDTDQSDP
jgi:tetratricopeptide (TPR) repeat protein